MSITGKTLVIGIDIGFNLDEFLRNLGIRIVLVNQYHIKRSKELDDNSQQGMITFYNNETLRIREILRKH